MLYAQTHNTAELPLAWEEAENLAKMVNRRGGSSLGYQIIWERKMFAVSNGGEYRIHIKKWLRDAKGTYPTVVLVTDDPSMAVSALRMLLITVQDEVNQMQETR